jgi:RNA polymerase sigma-70 factor (ECF subfamily)
MWSESDLIRGTKCFDLDCLAEIYDRYSEALYAYAMRLLGSPDLAEECVAETFARFLQAVKARRGPDTYLQAYLYRIAHNWITDSYRRQPPPPLELDETLQASPATRPDVLAGQHLEQARVRAALRSLTPDQRQVIVLRYLEGLENEAISAALQKPVGAIKALQHRALASLRRLLKIGEGELLYETSR